MKLPRLLIADKFGKYFCPFFKLVSNSSATIYTGKTAFKSF